MTRIISFKKNGFNLLTMSIVITIVGIIMSSVVSYYKINNIKLRINTNNDKFRKIELALKDYFVKYRRFPCPAPLNCNMNQCENNNDKLGIEKINIDGYCDYDNKGIFISTNKNKEKIIYGNIPAISLGLSNNEIVDAYGNKIVYVIPESLTYSNNYDIFMDDIIKKEKKEYVKDGIIYLLIAFNHNNNGSYFYKKTSPYNFDNNINMPVQNFEIDINKNGLVYKYQTYNTFNLLGLEEEYQSCKEYVYDIKEEKEVDFECKTFEYSGNQESFIVPSNVRLLKLEVWGAEGGSSNKAKGGNGGYSYGYINVSSGQELIINVGGTSIDGEAGYNGGGTGIVSKSGGGGGRTDISLLNNILIVAGGGGGASEYDGGFGGGGNSSGGRGQNAGTCGGEGGNNGSGGKTLINCDISTFNIGNNINGGDTSIASGKYSGAGGGGYGGGSSGGKDSGGGGGGAYIGGVFNGGGADGINSGNGKVKICYSNSNFVMSFPSGNYGEIVFSNELCPNSIEYPLSSSDYYYLSNYIDDANNVISNKMAKKCGKNGKWESGFIYTCKELPKCSKPSSIYPNKEWIDLNFSIVNMGIIEDKNNTLKLRCIYNNNEAKYYEIK